MSTQTYVASVDPHEVFHYLVTLVVSFDNDRLRFFWGGFWRLRLGLSQSGRGRLPLLPRPARTNQSRVLLTVRLPPTLLPFRTRSLPNTSPPGQMRITTFSIIIRSQFRRRCGFPPCGRLRRRAIRSPPIALLDGNDDARPSLKYGRPSSCRRLRPFS